MREIGIDEAKKLLVEAAKHLDELCEKNGLTMYLAAGSLLGAVRHKGFIPWDDDIDVFMTRPDYDRLVEICRADNNGRYKLLAHELDKNYLYTFGKMVDTRTLLIEKGGDAGVEMGLFIDIFPLDGLGNDVETAKKHMKKVQKLINLNLSFLVKPWRKEVPFLKNAAIAACRVLATVYGKERIHKKLYESLHSLPYEDSALVGGFCDQTSDSRIWPKEIFFGKERLPFEDTSFYAPSGWDEYLTRFFGDYMTPPPPEKQVLTHGYELYDKDS